MAAFSASLAAFLSALVDGFFFPAVVPVAAVESAARSSSLPLSSSAATGTTLTPPQAPPRRRLSSSAASDDGDGDDIGAELDCTRLIPIIREGSLTRLLGGAGGGAAPLPYPHGTSTHPTKSRVDLRVRKREGQEVGLEQVLARCGVALRAAPGPAPLDPLLRDAR